MTELKLKAGDFMIPVKQWEEGNRLFFQFGYNKKLLTEIKQMEGAKWHGYDEVNPRKVWSILNTQRNQFQLTFLKNKENPYSIYDCELKSYSIPPTRFSKLKNKEIPLLKHQPNMAAHMIQRGHPGCILAGETGVTKTLACIIALEKLADDFIIKYHHSPEVWYCAPRLALRGVQREFLIWQSKIRPIFMTYNEVVKRMKNWESGQKAPPIIVYDESHNLKTPNSQRSQSAKALADGCRADWPEDSIVILMTGTPAPKSPADWYWQAEIACPGFLKEGDINKFKRTLGIIVEVKGIDGVYPRFVTWRDDESKCDICGQSKTAEPHTVTLQHEFVPSINEVSRLYRRLKGLVEIFLKKDCLDLPDKHYRIIEVKPTPSILRAASMIVKTSATTIEGLTKLRELSDGFQYVDKKTGNKKRCPRCEGLKIAVEYEEIAGTCPNCKDGIVELAFDGSGFAVPAQCQNHLPQRKSVEVSCPRCGGTGQEDEIERTVVEVKGAPKDGVIIDLLDEYEAIGRIVIFGGFTGSIDKILKLSLNQGWHVIRLDQGKERVYAPDGSIIEMKDWLSMFQDLRGEYPRVVYLANADSGGEGVTLTASCVIVYFSNTFNGKSRMQSEDRIHRPGMDYNLGATIIDIVHLPSDLKMIVNLRQKKDLQSMSLGEFAISEKELSNV